jgi:hypothetical protein
MPKITILREKVLVGTNIATNVKIKGPKSLILK